MFKPRPARNQLNQMGGIMSSSPQLIDTVARFQLGGSVPDPYFARMTQDRLPAIRPGSFAAQPITSIRDFLSMANEQSGIGQIQQANEMARAGITPEDMSRVQAATQANQSANMLGDLMSAGSVPTMRGPTAADIQGAGIGGTPTIDDVLTSDMAPAEIPTEIPASPEQLAAGLVPTMRGPRAEDVRAQQAPPANTVPDLLKRLPNASDIQNASPEAQIDQGKVIQEEVTKFLGAEDVDENERNDVALTLLNKKAPDETLTKKQRIEKNREAYRELFGMDPEKDKQIDGYNLAMMGFLIASGDSPNALQNIARGAAAGLQNFQKTAEKRQSREDKLTELAIQDYRSQLSSEAEQTRFEEEMSLKREELDQKRETAKSREERERLSTILGFKDRAGALAMARVGGPEKLSTEEGFNEFMTVRAKLIEENPDLVSEEGGARRPMSRVDYIEGGLNTSDYATRREINMGAAAQLGIDPKNVTREQRAEYLANEYDRLYGASANAQTPPPATADVLGTVDVEQFPVGSEVRDAQGRLGIVQADGKVVAKGE